MATRRSGRRVNLADLAATAEEDGFDAPQPAFVPRTRHWPVEDVSPNPRNRRRLTTDRAKRSVTELVESIQLHGQLQACSVVTRDDYLRLFPEDEQIIGTARYVQISGARRRAAVLEAGHTKLKIDILDGSTETRAGFLAKTNAENVDRENLDPIEEAEAVRDLVTEAGSRTAAAEALTKTPAWVTQRLNLLKLSPEVQQLVRSGEVPVRAVRGSLHKLSPEEQLRAVTSPASPPGAGPVAPTPDGADPAESAAVESAAPESSAADSTAPTPRQRGRPRVSPTAAALRRLGGSVDAIAAAIRAEMPREDRLELAKLLQEE